MGKTNKTKIFFLFSPPSDKAGVGELSEGMIPPIGLVYLATYINEKLAGKVDVQVADGTIIGFDESIARIKEFEPDIVCVSFYTPCAFGAYKVINAVKDINPDILTIGGGPHVTPLPEEALTKSKMDIAVIGEGEETLLELVDSFIKLKPIEFTMKLSEIKGIAYRQNDVVITTEMRPYIQNLDSIPFPDWDLLPLDNYSGWYIKKGKKEAPLMFSRGCPFNCTFCSNAVWKVCKPYIRTRSPKNVADEIEQMVKKYGVDEIYDCSDEFNNDQANGIKICEEIKKRNLNIYWKSQLRAWPLDEDLVKAMAESNCWYVNLGIETGNPETLKGIGKFITLDQVERACKLLKKNKMKVQGLFMLYNVWEDDDGKLVYEGNKESQTTLKFASSLINKGLLDFIGWSVTTPYPGSRLYDIALRHDLIKPEFKGQWDQWLKSDRLVMSLPGIKDEDMIKLKTKGSLLRFWCIIRSRNFTFRDLLVIFRKGIGVIKMNLKRFKGNK